HDRGGVGIAAGHLRHNRGVGDAQSLDPVDRNRGSTTASTSRPIRQVPTGCRLETPRTRISWIISASFSTWEPGNTSSATKGFSAGCAAILRLSRIPRTDAVDLVMVAGEVVYQDGRFTRVDRDDA